VSTSPAVHTSAPARQRPQSKHRDFITAVDALGPLTILQWPLAGATCRQMSTTVSRHFEGDARVFFCHEVDRLLYVVRIK